MFVRVVLNDYNNTGFVMAVLLLGLERRGQRVFIKRFRTASPKSFRIPKQILQLTERPTWLLWRLIFECKSKSFSFESRNFLEYFMPYWRLCEQPPHFHSLIVRRVPFALKRWGSQPQFRRRPWLHAFATDIATPAEDIA